MNKKPQEKFDNFRILAFIYFFNRAFFNDQKEWAILFELFLYSFGLKFIDNHFASSLVIHHWLLMNIYCQFFVQVGLIIFLQ